MAKKRKSDTSETALVAPATVGEVLLYQTEDGLSRIEVRLENETVWLTQNQMTELFQTTKQNISLHIQNVFEDGELVRESTVKESLTVQQEGSRTVQRVVELYNLDVIISVGYRVKSQRGTQFRIWATQRLREYLIKGFTMDDERLKQSGGGDYFDELLARIRDIRSSEKVFWKKVLEIYATSSDYDPKVEASKKFFATVQNKMHWAAHGHTAAEIVHERADANQPNMGMTNWKGGKIRKDETSVAKNYLNPEELEALNLIVSLYLDFAELQARNRRPMTMQDWITKLDGFMRLSEREILTHAGSISHEKAALKAEAEFEKFRVQQDALPSPVEKHFEEAIKKLSSLKPKSKAKRPKS